MTATTNVRHVLLTLVAVVIPVVLTAAVGDAAAKSGYSVATSPASKTVQRGDTASYAVTVAGTGGFTGSVALSASGVPSGATASFSPSSVSLSTYATSAAATLNVVTAKTMPTGTYSFTVSATSGRTVQTTTVGLTVQTAQAGSFALAMTPATLTIAPGQAAVYTVNISRTSFTNAITFSASGLPTGATAAFSPNPASGSSATLQVATTASTPEGTSTISVRGSAGSLVQTSSAQLVVAAPAFNAKPFTIAGDLSTATPLSPGVSAPLDLTLSNPNSQRISVSNLSVSISGVSGSCAASNYAVTQYTGSYPLVVPAGATVRLSDLNVAASAMPRVRMIDLTTNQDACKGATVSLAYSGTGQGS